MILPIMLPSAATIVKIVLQKGHFWGPSNRKTKKAVTFPFN